MPLFSFGKFGRSMRVVQNSSSGVTAVLGDFPWNSPSITSTRDGL